MLKNDSFRPTTKYAITLYTPKIIIKKFYFFFSSSIRISGKNVNFGEKIIKKSNFYKNKKAIKIDDIDVSKVSKEEPYGTKSSFKYFIGYNDNGVIRLLRMKVPQMIGYVRKFEGNTIMSFKINDSKLLKKVQSNMEKVEKSLKIKFDSEPVYGDNDKYINTKIKIYGGSVNTDLQDKKMPRE